VKTTLQTWGNSQGIRLSKTCLSSLGWQVGDELELNIKSGALALEPARRPIRGRYRIEELVRRMPKRYQAKEVEAGPPQGREVW